MARIRDVLEEPDMFKFIFYLLHLTIILLILLGMPIMAYNAWFDENLENRAHYRGVICTVGLFLGPSIYGFYREIFRRL